MAAWDKKKGSGVGSSNNWKVGWVIYGQGKGVIGPVVEVPVHALSTETERGQQQP
jgi:hypothetical protein